MMFQQQRLQQSSLQNPHPGLKRKSTSLTPLAFAIHLACTSLAGVGMHAQAQNAVAKVQYDLPAGDLAASLNRYAQQSGVAIAVDATKVQGLRAPALKGQYAVEEGFQLLLSGSGYKVAKTPVGYVLVVTPAAASAGQAQDNNQQLPLVKVQATADAQDDLPRPYAGGQVARKSSIGVLGNQNFMDTPFNAISYTAELIQNQQAHSVAAVLQNDPSVRFMTPTGHLYENFIIRGFDVTSTELALNGMFGLTPMGQVPTEFIERVEVLKGPGAMVAGMSPYGGIGGVINLIPKRAADAPLTRLTVDYLSGAQWGTHLDLGRRFGADNQFGIRFNGAYRDGETGVDGQSKKRSLGALALDYRGDTLRVSVDAYSDAERMKGGSPMIASFYGSSLPAAPDSKTNAFPGIHGDLTSKALVVRADVDINASLNAYAGLGGQNYQYAGFINGTRATNVKSNGDYMGFTFFQRGYTDTVSAEAGLRGRLQTGDIKHQWALGLTTLDAKNGNIVGFGADYASNIYRPVAPVLARDPGDAPKTAENKLSSLALSDTLSFAGDKVLLTLGLRQQRVVARSFNTSTGALTANYDEKAVTPTVAIVVKPWAAAVSLYGNYIEGLSQGGTVNDQKAANYGQMFAPYKAKQFEAGLKWDTGSFAHTFSLFQITKPSMLRNAASNTYSADGEQRNRGLEWGVFGEISKGLRLLGGMSFTRAELTRTENPALKGKTAYGNPDWQANLGAEWDVAQMPGLSLNARVNHVASQFLDSANTLKADAWTRWDIGARYATKVQGRDAVLRAGVTNVFNKNYWSGTYHAENYVTQSAPRTVSVSLSTDF